MCMYDKMYVYVYVESSIKCIFSFTTGHDKMCYMFMHTTYIHTVMVLLFMGCYVFSQISQKYAFRENICNHDKLFLH